MRQATLGLACCLPALLLGGCAKTIERPDRAFTIEAPAAWKAAPEASEAAPNDWWEYFTDPGLDQAVKEALEHNKDLAAAAARIDAAQAQARIAGAPALPELAAGFSRQRQRLNFIGLPIPGPRRRSAFEHGDDGRPVAQPELGAGRVGQGQGRQTRGDGRRAGVAGGFRGGAALAERADGEGLVRGDRSGPSGGAGAGKSGELQAVGGAGAGEIRVRRASVAGFALGADGGGPCAVESAAAATAARRGRSGAGDADGPLSGGRACACRRPA